MKAIAIFITLVLLIAATPGLALGSAGSSSFTFLRVSAGSRPAALAEAVTASGIDVTSAFYNPALLRSFKGNNQAAFMYNSYLVDVTQNYLALASKNGKFAFGGYLSLGKVADIERWTSPDTVSEGTFDENNFIGALGISYGCKNIDLGLSVKYAYEKIDYASASAFMIDAGIYIPVTGELNAGASIKNIGSEPKFELESYPLPKEYRLGLSYKPVFLQHMVEFLADAVFYSDIDTKFNFGAEYIHKQYFALRTGYGIGYDSRGISFGGGVFYRQFTFDYAYVGYSNNLGDTHRFTVGANF